MIGSSLKANAVQHTSGKVHGRAIPRREGEPEADIYVDRPLSGPQEIRLWRFEAMRPVPLAALSPGDRFTSRFSRRLGMVLAQGRALVEDEAEEVQPVHGLKLGRQGPRRRAPVAQPPKPLARFSPFTLVRWTDYPDAVELGAGVIVTPGWFVIEKEVQP